MENKTNMTKEKIFEKIDIATISDDENFKEESVREQIILPIIKKLGYTEENIVRSKTLEHPFLKVGSNKKIAIKLVPDYVIMIDKFYPWVLDAKSPKQKIINDENVEQVHSYASHKEIESNYFALCNGVEFAVYRTNNIKSPALYFKLADIESHWEMLERYLSFNSLQSGKDIRYE
jgi:hypothetical protein